jgi:hypothetical protein
MKCAPRRMAAVSYFAVFLCGSAPSREMPRAEKASSRKVAKAQRFAKPN